MLAILIRSVSRNGYLFSRKLRTTSVGGSSLAKWNKIMGVTTCLLLVFERWRKQSGKG